MKPFDMKTKLYLVIGILCGLILTIWSIFYGQTLKNLTRSNENYVTLVSGRFLDTLGHTFLNLEYASIIMSANGDVKEFLKEGDFPNNQKKAETVGNFLESICRPDSLVEQIILYGKDGYVQRIRGSIDGIPSKPVGHSGDENQTAGHFVISLDGITYIGYQTGIYDHENLLGYLVFLIPEERLQRLFFDCDPSGGLHMGIIYDHQVILSNDSQLTGSSVSHLMTTDGTPAIQNIGFTPFGIFISDGHQAIQMTQDRFAFSALITLFILLGSLIFFWKFLHNRFLHPMFSIIQNAKDIGANMGGEYLSFTGQRDFDSLVDQINSMVERLQENRQAIYDLDLKRQKAVILSLKKQINAHFTVNSLMVIKRLNENGQQHKVSEMSDDLCFLLRYVNDPEEYIDGLDEVFILEKYTDIMQIRYPDTFLVEFFVDEKIDSVQMPRMLVQPLVENAIMHGLCPAGKKGLLTIEVHVEDPVITFCIADDGVGMSEEQLNSLNQIIRQVPFISWDEMGIQHIAIPNIQKRVVSIFGSGYGLTVNSSPRQGTRITLSFPATYITCRSDGIGSGAFHKTP